MVFPLVFKKFIEKFGDGRRKSLIGFVALSIISGILEFVGIALIYPFVLLIISNNHSGQVFEFFKTNFPNISNNSVILYLGVLILALFITKNLFMVFSLYRQNKFMAKWKLDINAGFMAYFMYSSYRNSLLTSISDKLYNLNVLCNKVIDEFVIKIMTLITNVIILSLVLLLLVIKFPFAAILTALFVMCVILIQNVYFKSKTKSIQKDFLEASVESGKYSIEILQNIKELKIFSNEDAFYNEFIDRQKKLTDVIFRNGFYGGLPPYIAEIMIVFAIMMLSVIIFIQNASDINALIASYSLIVVSIFRIAPVMNKIQSSLIMINASKIFAEKILEEPNFYLYKPQKPEHPTAKSFNEEICLENVTFSYDDKTDILKDINLTIKKGEFIGIIGPSGAGKSTLTDIIMGLLPTNSGNIFIDNQKLTENNFSTFRSLVGYVPQETKLLDGSIRENIEFGCENATSDSIEKVLHQAQLYDAVNQLPDGIETNITVGTNGFSQGQKQRLAIARALYRDPQIIILDEATSSLDIQTEHEITKILNSLHGEKTIIAIAHRFSTLKACDRLIYLKDGKIVDTGTFAQLSERYPDFHELIKLSNIDN